METLGNTKDESSVPNRFEDDYSFSSYENTEDLNSTLPILPTVSDHIHEIYEISEICKKSFPCLHTLNTNIGKIYLRGDAIYKLQIKLYKTCTSHFEKYKKYIQIQDEFNSKSQEEKTIFLHERDERQKEYFFQLRKKRDEKDEQELQEEKKKLQKETQMLQRQMQSSTPTSNCNICGINNLKKNMYQNKSNEFSCMFHS